MTETVKKAEPVRMTAREFVLSMALMLGAVKLKPRVPKPAMSKALSTADFASIPSATSALLIFRRAPNAVSSALPSA